ncbi:MAG: HlyD family type I secretion periplasmic adaptor subunit [Xanthobacteraceae bacterium]
MSKVSAGDPSPINLRSSLRDPALSAILEFQWPSTAIVNAPVPGLARGIVWVITSMIIVTTATIGFIPIDQVVTARGIVASRSPTILVQPLETTIIRSIDVREGQRVKTGHRLATLDPTFATADFEAIASQVASLDAEATRLRAELDGETFAYSGSDPKWALQAAIYSHRKAEFEAKLSNYNNRIDELSALISRSESDAKGYRERFRVAGDIEQMRMQLQEKEAGSKLNTLLATDIRVEMARALANAERTAEGAKLDQAARTAERDAFVRGWLAAVSQQLSVVNGKLNDAREQLNKATLRRQLVELRSEQNATVQSVAKVSVGSVLQSGEQLFTLVPDDAPLEVEANISGRDSGYVHVNDQVAIKFDTFPFSQYGMADGVVRVISPDSFTTHLESRRNHPTSAAPLPSSAEPFYHARITIDNVRLHDIPAGFRIMPGMPVTADIKVGKRTILQYFLGLVLPVVQEGMREP